MAADTLSNAPRERVWPSAMLWGLALGVVFFSSYGFANWMASRSAYVGEAVYAWERSIPFLAWTIVPYWSIDFLYGLSLFLCKTRRELHILVARLFAAQAIAVTIFLVFPLRFTFERPAAEGLFGTLFDVLAGFDQPFNQVPSLHISLLVILWLHYARHIPHAWHGLLHGWFVLIGVSVLTTYQHHFIDVPTGLWVGWFCLWLIPDHGRALLRCLHLTKDRQRRRIAGYYGAGALVLAAVAIGYSGLALWLLWVAGALGLVAVIYGLLDETAFQKQADGRLTPAVLWLFAPYLLGAWLNSRWWTRRANRADRVAPGLLLGRVPSSSEGARAEYGAIVDLCAELPGNAPGKHYHSIPILDLTLPQPEQLHAAVRAIEAARGRGQTLVCCALGYSRSALACVTWLVYAGYAKDVNEAAAQVQQARAGVVLKARHLRAAAAALPALATVKRADRLSVGCSRC